MIFVMCTSDPRAFLYEGKLSYHIEFAPNFYNLLIMSDIDLNSSFYLLQKIGHFLSFGFLYYLLVAWMKRPHKAFVLCVLFALFTEILQLFFHRSGRLFDVGIDLLGIITAYLICTYINSQRTSDEALERSRSSGPRDPITERPSDE
ncbi:VanZ family protein [Bhargavaea cecembensis]|uniref:VanZ family protein n=1 Tax=Bhargavaea cecembensis TaxID=394098 RepID=UPI0012E7367E|nr:VanZ family protein [Bhargavaea cecembensis]